VSLSAVSGFPRGISEGSAVRMSAPNYWWAGVITALEPTGRAEVMITDPGDSIHCAGQLVTGDARLLEPLRGRAADRELARAQAMAAPSPPAGRRYGHEEPVQLLIEAIQERGHAASWDLDDAVAYLGDRITGGCEAIAAAVDLAGLRQEQQPPRPGWRRRR
jgi:hypothetical protein